MNACAGCFSQKLSCQTGGVGGKKKKAAEEKDACKLSESSKSDRSGMGWLEQFSTMKVGPTRHVKESADTLGKRLGRKEEVISQMGMTRTVGLVAKRRLERYSECHQSFQLVKLTPISPMYGLV